MPKKSKSKQEDLERLLTTTLTDEGYEVDGEVEREVTRFVKFLLAREVSEDDEEDPFEDQDDGFYSEEDLFDDYGEDDDEDDDMKDEDEE